MGSEMPSFLVWSLCIKPLVHHEAYSIIILILSQCFFYAILINYIISGIFPNTYAVVDSALKYQCLHLTE